MKVERSQDVIALRGLSAVGKHGVYDFERSGSQVFSADLTLYVDSRQAAETDDVQYTVDYSKIAEAAVDILTGPPVYLIETLANNLAQMALRNPQVLSVQVTIHKPMAPVHHQFSDVSVSITRSRETITPSAKPGQHGRSGARPVILALGSNQGNSPQLLARAVGALIEVPGIEVDDVSPLVVTQPVLGPGQLDEQPNYYNAVLAARTVLSPQELLAITQSIENQFGRVRTVKWGPRTLDIDLIDFDGEILDLPDLQLPHPRALGRAFVLYPWALMDPEGTFGGEAVGRLAQAAPDRSGILQVVEDWLDESQLYSGEIPVEPIPASRNVVVVPETPKVDEPSRPEVLRLPPPPARPEIEIRGNRVSLEPLAGDSLFQRMLDREDKVEELPAESEVEEIEADSSNPRTFENLKVAVRPTTWRDTPAKAVPPAPSGAHRVVPAAPVVSSDRGRTFPSRTTMPRSPAVDADEYGNPPAATPSGSVPALPDWRFSGGNDSVRIVDAGDGGDSHYSEPNPVSGQFDQTIAADPSRRASRPTATGAFYLPPRRRGADSNYQGQA